MAEKVVRDILIKIAHDPASGSIESSMHCKDVTANIMWEALKNVIVNTTKAAPWVPDPEEREVLVHASNSMKLMVLGVEQAVAQIRERRRNQNKELTGGPG